MLINQTAKALSQFGLRVADDRFVRATAQAGAKARLQSGFRQREKENVFMLRTPRGARRAAVNAGRAHAVIEQPIVACVARLDGAPKSLFRVRSRRSFELFGWSFRHFFVFR